MSIGKASMHKSAVYQQLEGLHGEISICSDEPLSLVVENAKAELQKILSWVDANI